MSAVLAIGSWVFVIGVVAWPWWRQSYNRRAERRAQRFIAAMDEVDRQEIEARCERALDREPIRARRMSDGIARSQDELERLANVPCAPDPRRLA